VLRGALTAIGCAALLAAACWRPSSPAYVFGKNKVHYDSFAWQVYHSRNFDFTTTPRGHARQPDRAPGREAYPVSPSA